MLDISRKVNMAVRSSYNKDLIIFVMKLRTHVLRNTWRVERISLLKQIGAIPCVPNA